MATIDRQFTSLSIFGFIFQGITSDQAIILSHPTSESCLYIDTEVAPNATEVTGKSISNPEMSNDGFVFDFEEGLRMDFSDTKWDLVVPFGTASKDNNSDNESLPFSTDTIMGPLDIHVYLYYPLLRILYLVLFWCLGLLEGWRDHLVMMIRNNTTIITLIH